MEVVRDSDVSKAKEKFSKIISEHVYSVHKPIMDLQLLATADSGDVKYSAIKFDAKIRSDEEMQLLRWGSAAKQATVENVLDLKSTDSTNPCMTEKNTTKKISPQRENLVKKESLNHFFDKLIVPSKSVEVTSYEKKDNNARKDFIEEKLIRENKNLLEKKWNRSKETDEIAKHCPSTYVCSSAGSEGSDSVMDLLKSRSISVGATQLALTATKRQLVWCRSRCSHVYSSVYIEFETSCISCACTRV